MLRPDVLKQMIFTGKTVKVLIYFFATRIDPRPVDFWLKAPSIVVSWNITSATEDEDPSVVFNRDKKLA